MLRAAFAALAVWILTGACAFAQGVNVAGLPLAPGISDADLIIKYDATQVSGQRTQRYTVGSLAAYIAGKIPVGPAGPPGSVANLPSCTPGSSVAPVPTGQPFQCGGVILIAQ